ncbi:antitermination factor : Marine sediment metagenome DNA, contig: S01H1_S30148 (Fragment) OS=marine sediment metagenome GN=S01H1_67797 PE=4 SV=1: NusG [Gemmataceae bacterium]
MPLLGAEPVAHPPTLFSDPDTDRRWWVFQTRPRAEKAFARALVKANTAYFLPQFTQTWRKNGRRFESRLPLFPGYVFAAGDEAARLAAFGTNLVVRDVPAHDQEKLAAELRAVNRLMGGGEGLRPEEGLQTGTRVLVVEGAYAGVEGRVVEAGGEVRVCVEISLLGRGVSVRVDRWMLKALELAV